MQSRRSTIGFLFAGHYLAVSLLYGSPNRYGNGIVSQLQIAIKHRLATPSILDCFVEISTCNRRWLLKLASIYTFSRRRPILAFNRRPVNQVQGDCWSFLHNILVDGVQLF